MEDIITIDRFGRLVIPRRIRKALQVSLPADSKVKVIGSKIELVPLSPESGRVVRRRRGLLVVSTGGKKLNAAEAVRVMRDERTFRIESPLPPA